MIARESRISLVMDRKERHFMIHQTQAKYELFELLSEWLRALPPEDLTFAIKDLCQRYSTDIEKLSAGDPAMDWNDLGTLAADPNVTIGSATVNYPALSSLRDTEAQREISMGRAVTQAAFHREICAAFCPLVRRRGHRAEARRHDGGGGFTSAASTIDDVIEPLGRTNLHALPRIASNGPSARCA